MLICVSFVQLVQYDKNCCLFLERMRLYSSYDLVQKFKSFIKDFVGVQHDSAETCSEAVHAFVEVSCILGRALELLSITSDRNSYSHFIITLFMLFCKQQMPRILVWIVVNNWYNDIVGIVEVQYSI